MNKITNIIGCIVIVLALVWLVWSIVFFITFLVQMKGSAHLIYSNGVPGIEFRVNF